MVLIGAVRSGQQIQTAKANVMPPVAAFVGMIAVVIALHLGVLFLGRPIARLLRINREDQIAVAISGSQKTLMVGLSIAITYFGGLAILPMVTYHIAQLFLDTLVADRWRRETEKNEP